MKNVATWLPREGWRMRQEFCQNHSSTSQCGMCLPRLESHPPKHQTHWVKINLIKKSWQFSGWNWYLNSWNERFFCVIRYSLWEETPSYHANKINKLHFVQGKVSRENRGFEIMKLGPDPNPLITLHICLGLNRPKLNQITEDVELSALADTLF